MNKHYTTRNKNSNLVLIKVEKPASIWGCFTGKNKWSDLMRFHKCKLNIDLNPCNEMNDYSMLQAKKKVVFKVVRKPKNRKNSCDQGMSNHYCQNIKELMREVMCCKSNTILNNKKRSKSAYTLRQTDSIVVKTKVSQYNTRKQEQYEVYRNKKTKRNRYIKRSSMITKLRTYKQDHGGSGDKIESTTSYSSNNTEKEFPPLSSSATSKDKSESKQVITSKEKMIELLSTKVKGFEQIIQDLQSKNITETKKSMTGKKDLSKKCKKMLNSSNKNNLENETVNAVDYKLHKKTKTDKSCNMADIVSVEPVKIETHNNDWQKFCKNNEQDSGKQCDSVIRIISEPKKTAESSSGELQTENKNEINFIDAEKENKNDKLFVKKYTFKINQNLEERNRNFLENDISLIRKPSADEENNFENSEINYDVRKQTIQCTMNARKTKHVTENTNLQIKGKKHTFNELIHNASKSKQECKLHNDYVDSKEVCKKNSKYTQKTRYNLINNNDNPGAFLQNKNVNYEEVSKRLKHAMKINTDDQLYKKKYLPQIEVKTVGKTAKENFKIDNKLTEKENYENSDKTEAQKRENKSNLSIHIFIDENNTFQRAIAECSIIEKSNIQKNQKVHAVSTFSQKATNIKMDSLNMGDKQVQNLYGSCLQQKKINTYENEHAIILNSCFPNQYFNAPKVLHSVSLYNNNNSNSNSNNNSDNNNRNTSSSIKNNKTLHEVKSEHTLQCIKTDVLYHEFFNGTKPEYMDSEGRKQFELNQKTIRKRIPLCRKPIQYFDSTDKHGCNCQCNAHNSAIKSDITHDRYDSKEMMKDIKAIQLNDCKEIEDKIELYRKFKQIIDKHRERELSNSENSQIINHSRAVSSADKIHDDINNTSNNNDHADYENMGEINKINCLKCNASRTSVAVQTNEEHLTSANEEAILPQSIHQMEISKSVNSYSLLKQGSFLKSQISSPTDVSIKNSYFTSDMIPVPSPVSFNLNLTGQTFQKNETECTADIKNRFIDNQVNLVKHISSKTRRQSTSKSHRSQTKGMPICFPVNNRNTSLQTSSVSHITSKDNNSIVHCIIENLLFEISENLIKKLDKDQFQNHLDPLLRASTDYNFHSKVMNNHFSQTQVLDELITKNVKEFNALRTENLFKLITLLLDSVCEMLYDNYFKNSDYSSVR